MSVYRLPGESVLRPCLFKNFSPTTDLLLFFDAKKIIIDTARQFSNTKGTSHELQLRIILLTATHKETDDIPTDWRHDLNWQLMKAVCACACKEEGGA